MGASAGWTPPAELTELELRAAVLTGTLPETSSTLTEAIGMYRVAGYVEVAPFSDEPYAHHWFEKKL